MYKFVICGLPQGTKLGLILFAVLANPLKKDWHERMKFVDDATAIEIIPRCSHSLLPLFVNEIGNFESNRGMQLNPKKMQINADLVPKIQYSKY